MTAATAWASLVSAQISHQAAQRPQQLRGYGAREKPGCTWRGQQRTWQMRQSRTSRSRNGPLPAASPTRCRT